MTESGKQTDLDNSVSTRWITITVLAVALASGAGGAPLVGALRQSVQEQFGLSFWSAGAGVGIIGLAGGILGLILTRCIGGVGRGWLFRIGIVLSFLAFLLYYFIDAHSRYAVLALAGGWLIMSLGRNLSGISNAIFADLWHRAPQAGLILLHATNSIGKVVAPLLALIVGVSLTSNAAVYGIIWLILALSVFTWPRKALEHLHEVEHLQHIESRKTRSVLRTPLFWMVSIQFALIAGSEAGVTSTLPAFIEQHREPLLGLSARDWSQVVLVTMLLGIVAGRFAAFWLSQRIDERGIIKICLACMAAVIPSVWLRWSVIYLPCFFILGITFSATWPAFFALASRFYSNDKTILSVAAGVCTIGGVNGFILLSSFVGNNPDNLPWAVIISVAGMAIFAICLLLLHTRIRGAINHT